MATVVDLNNSLKIGLLQCHRQQTRAWRRRRDSNPRYSFPYGTLAMCWFQPLTHSSVGIPDLNGVLSPEGEYYAISGIWQVVMGVNSFLQSDQDHYKHRPPASI